MKQENEVQIDLEAVQDGTFRVVSDHVCTRCGKCCNDMDIPILHLLLPEAYLDRDGLDFYYAHGLDKVLKNDGTIKIIHRCDKLVGENCCSIFEDRPKACKEFNCEGKK